MKTRNILAILLLFLPCDKLIYPYQECWNMVKRTGKVEAWMEFNTGARMIKIGDLEVYYD